MTEAQYQAKLIKKIEKRFPGCFVYKNDPELVQGIPDLTILYMKRWAMLEVKIYPHSHMQPNQEYFVTLFKKMSYAAVIYPSIEDQILREMEYALVS